MNIYFMKKCSRCKIEHNGTSSNGYCSNCNRIAQKKSRENRKIRELNRKDITNDIDRLVTKILDNKMMVDLYDINDIITYYVSITNNIEEFSPYKSGRQLNLMFDKLVKYKLGNTKKNNI